MPTYSREEWLAGIKQIGSINKALKRDKHKKSSKQFLIEGELDEETKAYYESIGAIFERNNIEEIRGKVGEVISKLRGHPVDIVCREVLGSRILEAVFRVATEPQLVELLEIFKPHFTILINHITTTFVVQTMMTAISAFVNMPNSILADPFHELVQSYNGTWTKLVFRFTAVSVCNQIFRILGNLPLEDAKEPTNNPPSPHVSFRTALVSICKQFLAPELQYQFRKFCLSTNACRCMAGLTMGIEKVDNKVFETLAMKLITNSKGRYLQQDLILKVVRWGKFIVPILRNMHNPKIFHFYRVYLIKRDFFLFFKKYPAGQDLVMAALQAIKNGQFSVHEMTKTLKEIFKEFKRLFAYLKTDLTQVLFDIGAKFPELHTLIFDGFYELMSGDDALQFFSDLAFYSRYNAKKLSSYGVFVLKSLLQLTFQSKTLLLRSIYKSAPELVARVACDRRGIFDNMFTPDVPDLISNKLVKLVSHLVSKLVLTVHGTIFLIHLFERASTKNKKRIMEKLVPMKNILEIIPFSKPLIKRTKLNLYETDPVKWKKKVKQMTTKKDFFTQGDLDAMLQKHKQYLDERVIQKKAQKKERQKKKAYKKKANSKDNITKDHKGKNTKNTENNTTNSNKPKTSKTTDDTKNSNTVSNTENTPNTTNGKKRKLLQNGGEKTPKRTRLDRILDGEESKFRISSTKLGKYGRQRVLKSSKLQKEKSIYRRRLKKQIVIEKRRIDKQRADATKFSKRTLRAKSVNVYIPEIESKLKDSKMPDHEQSESV